MKHYKLSIVGLIFLVVGIAGCAKDRVAQKEELSAKVGSVEQKLDKNRDSLVQTAAEQVTSVQAFLAEVPAPDQYVVQAQESALVAHLALDEAGYSASPAYVADLERRVRDLESENAKVRQKAASDLQKTRDSAVKTISKIEADTKKLLEEKDRLLEKKDQAYRAAATEAEAGKAFKEEMGSWFGLGGVVYGLKTAGKWLLGGFIVLVVLLIAGAVFAGPAAPLFTSAIGMVIRIPVLIFSALGKLAPKAWAAALAAGGVAQQVTGTVSTKIIDEIETLARESKASGKEAALKDLLARLSSSMDTHEKAEVDRIKASVGWTDTVNHIS